MKFGLILMLGFGYGALAQNIIKNHSFEYIAERKLFVEGVEISNGWSGSVNKKSIAHWESPQGSTPAIIRNFKKSAHSGNVAVSLLLYEKKFEGRNYLEQELSTEIEEGLYFIMFYCKPVERNKFLSNNLGINFSKNKLYKFDNVTPIFNINDIIPEGWSCYSSILNLNGDEKYIYIGNFYINKKTNLRKRKLKPQYVMASYNIDDILLFKVVSHKDTNEFVLPYYINSNNAKNEILFNLDDKNGTYNFKNYLINNIKEEKKLTLQASNTSDLKKYAETLFDFYISNEFNIDLITLELNLDTNKPQCKIIIEKE
jgi:hypothetical protein